MKVFVVFMTKALKNLSFAFLFVALSPFLLWQSLPEPSGERRIACIGTVFESVAWFDRLELMGEFGYELLDTRPECRQKGIKQKKKLLVPPSYVGDQRLERGRSLNVFLRIGSGGQIDPVAVKLEHGEISFADLREGIGLYNLDIVISAFPSVVVSIICFVAWQFMKRKAKARPKASPSNQ